MRPVPSGQLLAPTAKATNPLSACTSSTTITYVARFFFTLTGVLGGVSVSRLIRFLTRDKAAARRSFERVLQWDFNRIVMAHGDVLEQGGPSCLRGALSRIGMTSD